MRLISRLFCLLTFLLAPVSAYAKTPLLLLTRTQTLRALESKGLSFATTVPAPQFASLVAVMEKDLKLVASQDPKAGVGMGFGHRLFDAGWLRSPRARLELSGVVNRLDRQPFRPDACGEIRLVYRLAYETEAGGRTLYSRLPMTVNVVFWAEKENGDCRAVAARWFLPERPSDPTPEAMADWLTSENGPLGGGRLAPVRLKSVETNLQSVRWPATIRPDLGGHAEYLLRVFHRDPQSGTLKPAPLENMPDLAKLKKDPKLLEALKRWVRDPAHLKSLDEGVPLLPEEFLALQATSVSPHGWARASNRPFSALFSEKDFADLDFSKARRIRSARGLLRRLDDVSCVGCHQARSVAGFHLLGEDPEGTMPGNGIATPASPHLQGDLPRRSDSFYAMADTGLATKDRPLSERADRGEGSWGSHCGLGDPTFAGWTCGEGLTCVGVHGEGASREVGECFSATVDRVGEPCERGTFRTAKDAHADTLPGAKANACGGGVCEGRGVGFPDGMCAVGCGGGAPGSACGSIAILTDFNACLARNEPFSDCLSKNVRPAGLKPCGVKHPCRDDYLCSASAGGATCIPPYFLFQMRVDGHPKP